MAYSFELFNNNSGWVLKDGERVCILRKHEVRAWIAKAEKAEADQAVYLQEQRKSRLAVVVEYLATRKARQAEAARQFSLF